MADIPQIPRLSSAILRLIEAHRNEVRAQHRRYHAKAGAMIGSGHEECCRCDVDRLLSARSGDLRRYASQRANSADRGPSAYHTAGKALSFSAAGPVNRRWRRLPGMQTRDLRLLKTLKTATVAPTPPAIW